VSRTIKDSPSRVREKFYAWHPGGPNPDRQASRSTRQLKWNGPDRARTRDACWTVLKEVIARGTIEKVIARGAIVTAPPIDYHHHVCSIYG
jgi:hypothetical protein